MDSTLITSTGYILCISVNQFLFMMTLFRDLVEKY